MQQHDITSKIDIYTDIWKLEHIEEFANKKWVKGFTTNPSLVRKSGAKSYLNFLKDAVRISNNLPISLEVISDDFLEMEKQAHILNSIGSNVYVKIPITNSKGESSLDLIKNMLDRQIKLNVTAIMTMEQVKSLVSILKEDDDCIISIFAGRIADTGVDPQNTIRQSVELISNLKNSKILWASPREVLNIFHAVNNKCHIITATKDILDKIPLLGKDLKQYSKETVEMFYNDALQSNFEIS
jgi:transaldolase